ncbi:unnamed protein product [Triticum turgidum subsp. durum]|uniref:Uncharacterized protein n=1 Tax=Triticum turgidum subsp. durum TaxID=4567 RepID=A0A9R0TEX9_TRITD|nr:unnamed protein product [Triticum turgidum subsp. durum]
MMSFKNHHEGFAGQQLLAAAAAAGQASGGAPLPWWVGSQLLYGEPMGHGKAPPAVPMSMSPPEDACRDGQFQVVPRAQALLDAVPLPPQPMGERGIPEALKFSMAHGKGGNSSEHSAPITLQSPFTEYNDHFELGLGQSVVSFSHLFGLSV